MTSDVGAAIEGWGHGQLGDPSDLSAGALCHCSDHTGLSVQSSVTRPGRPFALQVAHSSSFNYYKKNPRNVLGDISAAVYHRVDTVPGSDVVTMVLRYYAVWSRHHGIGIHNGKYATFVQVEANAIVWGADGPTVVAGEWTRLEAQSAQDGAFNTTTTGYAGGAALGSSTAVATAASSMNHVMLGNNNSYLGTNLLQNPNSPTFTEYFSDFFMEQAGTSDGVAHFPVTSGGQPADYQVEFLLPNADGTHVNGTDFSDDASTSPPNPAWSRLDDNPPTLAGVSDYIRQDTIGSTSYIEVSFQSLVSPLLPLQVAVYDIDTSDAAGTYSAAMKVADGANIDSIYSGSQNTGGVTRFEGNCVWDPGSVNRTPWTRSRVNALKVRLGYSTDVTPKPIWHAVFLQVVVLVELETDSYWGVLLQ